MSLKDLIAAAFNKDATAFESAFSSVMKEKVASAIDSQFLAREEYELEEAKKDDEDEMCEEVEQIDEISTELKKRYVEKGADDVVDRFTGRGKYERPRDPSKYTKTGRPKKSALNSPEAVKYRAKLDNRRDIVNKVSQEVHGKKRFGEEVEQIDEISGAKVGTYLIKARKSEAELDKKRDDSYDKPNTPENKAERKAISRTLNKRRWGQGKALDKLTGSSFAKVPATEK